MNKKEVVFIYFIIILLASCKGGNNPDEPIVDNKKISISTDSVKIDYTNLDETKFGLEVFTTFKDNENVIIEKGICYGEKPNPTLKDNVLSANNWSSKTPENYSYYLSETEINKTYYFRTFAKTDLGIQYGNEISYTTNLPISYKKIVKRITNKSAELEFVIVSDGGSPILSKGVVWSKLPNPTVDLSSKTSMLSENQSVVKAVCTGLEPATKYYARFFAQNKNGINYSNELVFITLGGVPAETVTDIDGNVYQTITIGYQTWMVENLRTTRYRNGDVIETTDPVDKDLSGESDYKYQWPAGGDESNVAKNGRLYTWNVVSDERNIAPTGWRVPSYFDFLTLEEYLIENGYNYPDSVGNFIGKSLSSTTMWESDKIAGNIGNDLSSNNYSGFNAQPVGIRKKEGFFQVNQSVIFWASRMLFPSYRDGLMRQLNFDYPDFYRGYAELDFGCSVRCIKGENE